MSQKFVVDVKCSHDDTKINQSSGKDYEEYDDFEGFDTNDCTLFNGNTVKNNEETTSEKEESIKKTNQIILTEDGHSSQNQENAVLEQGELSKQQYMTLPVYNEGRVFSKRSENELSDKQIDEMIIEVNQESEQEKTFNLNSLSNTNNLTKNMLETSTNPNEQMSNIQRGLEDGFRIGFDAAMVIIETNIKDYCANEFLNISKNVMSLLDESNLKRKRKSTSPPIFKNKVYQQKENRKNKKENIQTRNKYTEEEDKKILKLAAQFLSEEPNMSDNSLHLKVAQYMPSRSINSITSRMKRHLRSQIQVLKREENISE